MKYDYPTEVIGLPSDGKTYPSDSPLASGQIELKQMTAKEEEILTSQNLIRKGIVLDKLFESIISDRKINPDDILIGDKNAIMLATRILAYGSDYEVEVELSNGEKIKEVIDLTKVKVKDVDTNLLNRDNEYTFVTPFSKTELTFKLLTHGDDKAIEQDIRAIQKVNPNGASGELTTRYRYMIKAVNGNRDLKTITSFINSNFLVRDAKAFREYVKSIQPDINLEWEFENPVTGEVESRRVPMGPNFFWPST